MVQEWYIPYMGAVSEGLGMVWENPTLGIPVTNLSLVLLNKVGSHMLQHGTLGSKW